MVIFFSIGFLLYPSMTLLFSVCTAIFPLTTIYASEQLHKSDLSIAVLKIFC